MRWMRIALVGSTILLVSASLAEAQQAPFTGKLDSVVWRQARPGLFTAVVEGDPRTPDKPYALALRLEDGEWIPPHWHPREKRIVVIEGTVLVGFGDAIDDSSAKALGPGSVVVVPAEAHHYEGGRGRTVVLLMGTGPLTTTFVRQE